MSRVGEVDLVAVQNGQIDIQRMIGILQGEKTLNHPVNLISQFFQMLHKHIKRLEVVIGVHYRKSLDNIGLETQKQIVLPENCMLDIIRTMHSNPMQGHSGSKEML